MDLSPLLRVQPGRLVPPKRRSKRKRDRAAKQEALIRAATKLFASKGYDVTTTREIAAAAGCAEGLIHRYFQGKAGLLLGMMSYHASRDVGELNDRLPLADTLGEEIQQLMAWEVERMWRDRDLLRAWLPHAILDPKIGRFISRIGPQRDAKGIAERLRRHRKKGTQVSDDDIDAISQAIGALGFSFGFMRPVVSGLETRQARKATSCIGRIITRGLERR